MSGSLSELTIDSVTGIDVALPVAGAGARAFAFIIDWHIRLILAAAWFLAGSLLYNGGLRLTPSVDNDPYWFGGVVAPALAIYFLYHYVLELAMGGRTPGKRMAGVRVITHEGSTPSVGALLTRNVFRLIDSLPVIYGVGLIAVISTHEHRRIGDMAAGTLLAYDAPGLHTPAAAEIPAAYVRHDVVAGELITELLQRWSVLTPQARRDLAVGLLTRQGLRSEVLHELDEAALHAQLTGLVATPAPRSV